MTTIRGRSLAAVLIVGCAHAPMIDAGPTDSSVLDVIDAATIDANEGGASCTNNVKDGTETDVDCGGASCPACADGRTCILAADCKSLACSAGTCGTRAWTVESNGNNVVIPGNQTWIDLAASNLHVTPDLYAPSIVFMRWTGTLRFASGGNGNCAVGQRFVIDDVPTGDPTWGNALMVQNGTTRWHEMFTAEIAASLGQGLHTIRVQMTNGNGWGTMVTEAWFTTAPASPSPRTTRARLGTPSPPVRPALSHRRARTSTSRASRRRSRSPRVVTSRFR